jgi:antitoxin component YwqK of YwqJK toxin-antitoxin module
MNQLNDKGYWEQYYSNGNLLSKGNFINGERDGYWECYHSDGVLWYKGNFLNGEFFGYRELYNDGKIKGKEFYL